MLAAYSLACYSKPFIFIQTYSTAAKHLALIHGYQYQRRTLYSLSIMVSVERGFSVIHKDKVFTSIAPASVNSCYSFVI